MRRRRRVPRRQRLTWGGLRFRLNVLPGDASRDSRVDALDWMQLRNRQRRSTTNPGAGATGYSLFHDLDGNGVIDPFDMLHVRRNLTRALPTAEPAGAVLTGASITRAFFRPNGSVRSAYS